jgi:hypothetical protein
LLRPDLPHGKMLRRETLKISTTWKTGSLVLTVTPESAVDFDAKSAEEVACRYDGLSRSEDSLRCTSRACSVFSQVVERDWALGHRGDEGTSDAGTNLRVQRGNSALVAQRGLVLCAWIDNSRSLYGLAC